MIYSDRSRKSTYHLAAIRPSAHLPTQRSAYGTMSAFGTKRTSADCATTVLNPSPNLDQYANLGRQKIPVLSLGERCD
jgi:hypothetical protein